MGKAPSRGRSETPENPPLDIPDPQRRGSGYEPSHVIQLLVDLQKQTTAIATKMDRAIQDLEDTDEKVSKLSSTMTWIKGFGAAALVLIPLCAAFIWWFIGDDISQFKRQLIQAAKEPAIVITKEK